MRYLVKIGMIISVLLLWHFYSPLGIGAEVESKNKFPWQLDKKLVDNLWREIINISNEGTILKLDNNIPRPRIVFQEKPLEEESEDKLGDIIYWVDKKNHYILMNRPREIVLYRRAFDEELPDLPYGVLVQELFHEIFFYKAGSPAHHHCFMLYRGDLEKALAFLSKLLGNVKVSIRMFEYTKNQCRKDLRLPQAPEVFIPQW